MPRAPKLELFTEAETNLSRKYLAENLGSAMSCKLSLDPDGIWFRNPASGSTYNTVMIGKPDPQMGMVRVPLGSNASPLYGRKDATWLALHDPYANRVSLIPWVEFVHRSREAARDPHSQLIRVMPRQDQTGWDIMFNLDWARSVTLMRHSQPIKGSYIKWREKQLAEPENFVHLHNHSMFSLLDGASTIEGTIEAVLANGQRAIAQTDHGYMFGGYKHWAACVKKGVKPIMGVEAYLVDDVNQKYVDESGTTRRWEYHQTLLAMNEEGWRNLCKLMTTACRDHVYYVPRIDHKMLFEHNAGIICLSGCFKGMAAHYLQTRQLREGETKLPWWLERNPDSTRRYLQAYKQAFGDRFFGEVQNIDYEPYMKVVPELMQILDDVGVPKVATNDNHYEREEDAILQAVLTKISSQRVDSIGEGIKEKGTYYIKSRAEIAAGAPWMTADMMDRTCEIADRCNVSFERKGYLFPKYELSKDRDWAAFQESKKEGVS